MTAVAAPPALTVSWGRWTGPGPGWLDTAVRLGALVGLWSSLLLVAYWWATSGGIQALGAWVDGLTSTGRLTGLLAADLLLVQMLLMARVPALEHAFGQDGLPRIHRVIGH